ncbi:transmembrane emp24 domain-containing protein 11-like isoform X1 [Mobula hypostoma]|uniref:transmembrane emp24 domain-containing protein 11-like isoform X1 n=1 Tax=Mobula hypostoma TaxID=723540 RepID=UPI002FC38EC3
MKVLLKGLLFTLSCNFSFSFYFQQGERDEKCIIEDIPADTLVTGRHKMQSWDIAAHEFLPSAPGLGLFVTVKGPDKQILLHKLYAPESHFIFQSHSQGEHYICLTSNSTRLAVFAGSKLRINLDIQVGEHITEKSDETKDKIINAEERVLHLIERMQYISKQQDYQRLREEEFRRVSERTNDDILWWALVQTTILLTMGVWQMKHMKNFFVAKKLV